MALYMGKCRDPKGVSDRTGGCQQSSRGQTRSLRERKYDGRQGGRTVREQGGVAEKEHKTETPKGGGEFQKKVPDCWAETPGLVRKKHRLLRVNLAAWRGGESGYGV